MEKTQQEAGRVVLIRRKGKILALLYRGNRLLQASASAPEEDILNNIYIGKVKHIAENIQAAFVEYAPGALCFLPLKECRNAILTNYPRNSHKLLVAGDEIVIQICRERQKTKEAGASANLSFSGKYVVLTTGKRQIGYSSKLSGETTAALGTYLKDSALFAEVKKEYGIIFRTNAGELTDFSVLEEELRRLKEEADSLRHNAQHRTCFSLLKKAPAPYLKNLQDFYSSDYDRIITDDKELYQETAAYLSLYQPQDLEKLTFYEDTMLSLSKLYSVEARLAEATDRKVWLKSGGYLVIDRTEALICIDVNSGKYDGKKGQEETYLKINLEAAGEIGRQLLLRNISGIVIIDFINMEAAAHKRQLLDTLRQILAADPVRTAVVDMTPLGLVEVTRKKEKRPLWEQLI